MNYLILVGGKGTRLKSIVKDSPKPLAPLSNGPFLEFFFDKIGFSLEDKIHLLCGYKYEAFEEFQKKSKFNFNIIKEDKPLGTGGGILNAIDLLGDENFLVMNSDIFHKIDIKNLPKEIDAAHLIGVPNPSHNQEGDFCIKDNNKVAIDEFNDLTWSGISIINPIIFKEKNFRSGSFNIWDTVLPNYLNNGNVSAHKSNDLWIDVGTHERLKLANSLYNDQN